MTKNRWINVEDALKSFSQDERLLYYHIQNCAQCKEAGLGRFAGATVEEIYKWRCEEGKRLSRIASPEINFNLKSPG